MSNNLTNLQMANDVRCTLREAACEYEGYKPLDDGYKMLAPYIISLQDEVDELRAEAEDYAELAVTVMDEMDAKVEATEEELDAKLFHEQQAHEKLLREWLELQNTLLSELSVDITDDTEIAVAKTENKYLAHIQFLEGEIEAYKYVDHYNGCTIQERDDTIEMLNDKLAEQSYKHYWEEQDDLVPDEVDLQPTTVRMAKSANREAPVQ
jgi:hypothetical protein